MSLPARALHKVVLVVVTLAVVAVPNIAGAADLEVADAEVSPGQSVALTGSGFLAVAPVSLCWDQEGCSNLGKAQPGTQGSFTASVTIPDEVTAGTYQIFACQQPAGDCASAGVRVASSTTTSTTSTSTTSTTTSTTTTSTTTTTLASTTSTSATGPTTSSTTTAPATSGGSQPPTSTTPGATTAPSTTASTVASTTSSSEAADSTTSSTEVADSTTSSEVAGGSPPDSTDGTPSLEVRSGSLSADGSNADDGTVLGLAPLEWIAMVVVAGAMVMAVWIFDSRKRSSRRRYILDLNRPGNRGH